MNLDSTIKLLVILGPTATGKSDLAVSVAKMIEKKQLGGYTGAEIISADSRQVYKGMDIGTGKITMEEMRGIPHHLLDVADPRKQFSVIDWKRLAERSIKDIVAKEKLPIICGGTGFYIDALIKGIDFPAIGANEELRKQLKGKSASELFDMLQKLDPERASNMNESDSQNPRRLVRAIEIAKAQTLLSRDASDFNISKKEELGRTAIEPAETSKMLTTPLLQHNHYAPIFIGLQLPPEELRKRIHDRLLRRIDGGMLDEARRLHETIKNGGAGLSWKRMNELGLEYRYMADHLEGKMDQAEMTVKLETAISQYAKRQMTWFKRDKRIKWFDLSQTIDVEEYISEVL